MASTPSRVQFTTRAFQRSHGRRPSGRGTWGFQQSTTEVAFDADLRGDVLWANGTLAEAKRQVAALVPGGTLLAVLP